MNSIFIFAQLFRWLSESCWPIKIETFHTKKIPKNEWRTFLAHFLCWLKKKHSPWVWARDLSRAQLCRSIKHLLTLTDDRCVASSTSVRLYNFSYVFSFTFSPLSHAPSPGGDVTLNSLKISYPIIKVWDAREKLRWAREIQLKASSITRLYWKQTREWRRRLGDLLGFDLISFCSCFHFISPAHLTHDLFNHASHSPPSTSKLAHMARGGRKSTLNFIEK